MDNGNYAALRRFREPAAIVMVVLMLLGLLWSGFSLWRRAQRDGWLAAMRFEAGASMSFVLVLMAVIVIGSCVLWEPASRHSRLLARLAAVLVVIGTIAALANLVAGLMLSHGILAFFEFLGGGTDVVLKAVCAMIFIYLARRISRESAGALRSTTAAPAQIETTDPTVPREVAAGARWGSAAEAARGAQAEWGDDQGAASGWNPRASVRATSELTTQAEPEVPTETHVVQPEALEGPSAQASRDLWH